MAEKPRTSGDPASPQAHAAPVRRRTSIEPPKRPQGLASMASGSRSSQPSGPRAGAARRDALAPPTGASLEEPLESGPSDNTNPLISGPRDTTAVEDLSKVIARSERAAAAPPPAAPRAAARGHGAQEEQAEAPEKTRVLDMNDAAVTGGLLSAAPPAGREHAAQAQRPAGPASEVGTAWSNPTVRVAFGAAGVALVALIGGSLLRSFYTENDRPSRIDLAYLYPYRELQTLAPGRVIPRGREVEFTFEGDAPCPQGKSGCLLYSFAKDGFTGSMVVYRPGPKEEWQRIDEVQRGPSK